MLFVKEFGRTQSTCDEARESALSYKIKQKINNFPFNLLG